MAGSLFLLLSAGINSRLGSIREARMRLERWNRLTTRKMRTPTMTARKKYRMVHELSLIFLVVSLRRVARLYSNFIRIFWLELVVCV